MIDFHRNILPLKNIIFRTALRIVLSREEAEDIVQDTLMKLWQKREDLEQVANIEAFAIASARNLALDRKARMENRNVPFDNESHDMPDHQQSGIEQVMMQKESVSAIGKIINSLPEKQRTVIHLRDIEGKSYKEIAEALNISESDVKVTLFRARSELKEKIIQKKSFFL